MYFAGNSKLSVMPEKQKKYMNLRLLTVILLYSLLSASGFSQDTTAVKQLFDSSDSAKIVSSEIQDQDIKPEIEFTVTEALEYLQKKLQPQIWRNTEDKLRRSIERLVNEVSAEPFDSVEFFLRSYPYDSLYKVLQIRPDKAPDSVIVKIDSLAGEIDTVLFEVTDSIPYTEMEDKAGTPLPFVTDTIPYAKTDRDEAILPFVTDSIPFIEADTTGVFLPFSLETKFEGDSARAAVSSLLNYLAMRDSSLVNFTGLGNRAIPVWLNSMSGKMHRYWLRNEMNDSVTVWIGAQSRDTIGLYLEHGVRFLRPAGQAFNSNVKIEMEQQTDRSSLLKAKRIIVKPELWKYRTEASFALNQASLSNWVKGGESSISSTLDLTGYADYNNKAYKVTSSNFARLKYGLIATTANGLRTNLDLLETNSKINHKAFGKFDFSAVMLFKTQISKGFKYTDTTKITVSKFLNPGILTLGFGLDYKPDKKTSINFSPLSYKGTFVPDTSRIDQTIYGILADKKSKHEPGMSFLISHQFQPFRTVTMTNRLQLFTNYTHNPQNIDVDWEMILTASLNWFTDVRVNTHLIFDDDTKTIEYDKENNPVLGPDGKPKKTSRIQFKELLGFSFIFRF